MVIETGNLSRGALQGRVAVITGAGGGIGYEAARSLAWLGCRVVIAEIDRRKGQQAAVQINREFGAGSALFVCTDVGHERSVRRLAKRIDRVYGKVDIVLNNATIASLGAVKDIDIKAWDDSYRVNLRGPVLLARTFVPGMLARNWGVFACVSSTGTAYMGAYECFKAAQVHLGTTLSEELSGTEVAAFTIGPGFVPTQTANSSIPRLAALMSKPEQELRDLLRPHTLSVEAAGAGIAAAIAMASRYRGQEVSSMQALIDAGIEVAAPSEAGSMHQRIEVRTLTEEEFDRALSLCRSIRDTLARESASWKERSVFEQQWLIRTFRKKASMPVDEWLRLLEQLEDALSRRATSALAATQVPLSRLADYYRYLCEMAKGYVKDPAKREEQLGIVKSWHEEVEQLDELLQREPEHV